MRAASDGESRSSSRVGKRPPRARTFQWRLTDAQRALVVLAGIAAFFLAVMAWGGVPFLLVLAVPLAVGTAIAAYLLDRRHQTSQDQIVIARVLSVSKPPRSSIMGRCVMRVRVEIPGRPPADVKLRDRFMPSVRWPKVGQSIPVDMQFSNPRRLRIRWDLVDSGYLPSPTPRRAQTPPPPPGPPHPPPPPPPSPRPPSSPRPPMSEPVAESAEPRVHEEYADPPADPHRHASGHSAATDHDATTADRSAVQPDGTDFDPAVDVDRRDFSPDPVQSEPHEPDEPDELDVDRTIRATRELDLGPFESTGATGGQLPRRRPGETDVVAGVPFPRTPEPTAGSDTGTPKPTGAETTTGATPPIGDLVPFGGRMFVANLDRSLPFYTKKLGFTIAYAGTSTARLEYHGASITLEQRAGFVGVGDRPQRLEIVVRDIEAAYRDLAARGIEFSQRPAEVSRSEDEIAVSASFRDPDGYGWAITEYRRRSP